MGCQEARRGPVEQYHGFLLRFVPYDEDCLFAHRGQMKRHGMKAQIWGTVRMKVVGYSLMLYTLP